MKTLRKNVSKGTLGLWFLFFFVFHFPGQSFAAVDYVQLDPIAIEKVYFEDVAVTDYGRVYVIDGWKNKVLVMNFAGDVFGDIDVDKPTAVATGPGGILYVGSYTDGSVRKIDQNGEVVGVLGQGAGEFKCPASIVVDEQGNVYVLDAELQQIKGYDSTGIVVLEINDAPNLPKDIAVYNNEIFVLDQPKLDDSFGGQYHGARIRVYGMAGNLLRSFGSYGRSTGQFIRVKGITADNQGRILVSDSSLNRIQAFSPAGAYLGVIDGSRNSMESPREMVVTQDSRLLIASSTASTLYAFGLYNADGSASFLNQNPIADAGLDQIVDEGEQVTLDASNSTDPDGDGLFYQWRQVSGTLVSLSDSSAPTPTFDAPLIDPAGDSLTFELTVTDVRGMSDGMIWFLVHGSSSPLPWIGCSPMGMGTRRFMRNSRTLPAIRHLPRLPSFLTRFRLISLFFQPLLKTPPSLPGRKFLPVHIFCSMPTIHFSPTL